ncbi:MAG: hypothetical protein E7643_00650 [Ruminococcaceae bacterium]|nr:hypothetical protein [Oscillospiraceae bacterium]
MQTKAIVTEVHDSYAIVVTERTSACDGCHKAEEGGCSVCSLMSSDRKMSARASNDIGARVGDHVAVESDTGRMLFYAALIFVLPLVLGILSWAIVATFTDSSTAQALGGFGGFLLCFLAVFLYSRSLKDRRCEIRITEILDSDARNEEEN